MIPAKTFYLTYILTFYLARLSGRKEEERTARKKSRKVGSLDFIKVALSSSSSWHPMWHIFSHSFWHMKSGRKPSDPNSSLEHCDLALAVEVQRENSDPELAVRVQRGTL